MYLIIKKLYPHLVAILIFFLLVSVYFSPSIFQKKNIWQPDMQKFYGMAPDIKKCYKDEKTISAWTNRMFSGMPSYQIQVLGTHQNYLFYLETPIKSIDFFGASMLLTSLICFYVLMYVINVKKWLAIAGAIAFAFSTYHLIIILAGHITKMYVIAYMPLTIAGVIILFKKKLTKGMILFVLGICFSILNGHIQITYYLFIFCIFIFIGCSIPLILKKKYLDLIKICGIAILSIILAILSTLNNLYANYESSKESIRGQSNLILTNQKNITSSGLNKEYAFSWSYGKKELLTLLIPNIYGGSSIGMLNENSKFYTTYKSLGGKDVKTIPAPTYWGNQPFTFGPVYIGAVICFLFVLGMFVIQNKLKWWIAIASMFFICLSFGKNMIYNDFLFHHLPLYNKFRNPSMALVIPGMTFPFIGLWGLSEMTSKKSKLYFKKKSLIFSFLITGGICLLIWQFPNMFFRFSSNRDIYYFHQYPQLIQALRADRARMASSDAIRSFIFILLTCISILFFIYSKSEKTSREITNICILVLLTIDLLSIGKRYLNNQSFSKENFSKSYQPTLANRFILKDQSFSYRVLNLSVDTFNETHTSFFHQSIGGYHAAKMKRYQELINYYILNEINTLYSYFHLVNYSNKIKYIFKKTPILNMLNMKYLIYHPKKIPLTNPFASGSAWFVQKLVFVSNANKEIETLQKVDLKNTAVIHNEFYKHIKTKKFTYDTKAFIKIVKYASNDIKYVSSSNSNQLAIFSEIYYKHGWKSFIDQIPTEHFRVNWTLRGIVVPSGNHTIEFRFEPQYYIIAERIASISSLIIVFGIFTILIFHFQKKYLIKNRVKNITIHYN